MAKLTFSSPEARYESVAYFDDDKGQQFLIRVSGCNQATVEQYTKNLNAYLEVVLDESEKLQRDANPVPEAIAEQPSLLEDTVPKEDKFNPLSNSSLKIAVEVAKVQDIGQPQMLRFTLDHTADDLQLSEPPAIFYYERGVRPNIKITVDQGSVNFKLVEVNQSGQETIVDKGTLIKTGSPYSLKTPTSARRGAEFRLIVARSGNSAASYKVDGTVPVDKDLA